MLDAVESALTLAVETVAAVLLGAEIMLLFAGIVFRYLLHDPLIWGDELGILLFLWLGMLGAVVALRRWEHMRMTTLISVLPPSGQDWMMGVTTSIILVFLILLLPPALIYTQGQAGISSPVLEISMFWQASAMPTGVVLLIISTLLRFRKMPARIGLPSR